MRIATAAAALILFTAPALAADPPPPEDSREKQEQAAKLAMEATQKLMLALELLIKSLPQYGLPHIDEDGNIVIPRLPNPPEAQPDEDGSQPDEEGDEGMKL
jgi:hypothetical protein